MATSAPAKVWMGGSLPAQHVVQPWSHCLCWASGKAGQHDLWVVWAWACMQGLVSVSTVRVAGRALLQKHEACLELLGQFSLHPNLRGVEGSSMCASIHCHGPSTRQGPDARRQALKVGGASCLDPSEFTGRATNSSPCWSQPRAPASPICTCQQTPNQTHAAQSQHGS